MITLNPTEQVLAFATIGVLVIMAYAIGFVRGGIHAIERYELLSKRSG